MRCAWCVVMSLVLSGCFTYTSVRIDPAPELGTVVRAELTATGSETLASTIGADTRTVQGRLVSAGPESLRFAVLETQTRRGVLTPWQGESVEIPRPLVAELRVRRFSRVRTMLFTGGILAGALALGGGLGLFDGGPDRGGNGPGAPPR